MIKVYKYKDSIERKHVMVSWYAGDNNTIIERCTLSIWL